MEMKTVGVRELRQNLSKYLRQVVEGETFRVTDHGQPVAALGPAPGEAGAVDRLVARGRLRPARLNLLDLGSPPELPATMPISVALSQLRSED